jgi:hypothetical protein
MARNPKYDILVKPLALPLELSVTVTAAIGVISRVIPR